MAAEVGDNFTNRVSKNCLKSKSTECKCAPCKCTPCTCLRASRAQINVMFRKKPPTITNISFSHHGNEKMAEKLIKLVDTVLNHQTATNKVHSFVFYSFAHFFLACFLFVKWFCRGERNVVTYWLGRRTRNQDVVGSTTGRFAVM